LGGKNEEVEKNVNKIIFVRNYISLFFIFFVLFAEKVPKALCKESRPILFARFRGIVRPLRSQGPDSP